MKMDRTLVHKAQRLITGANVHRANTLIFQYQQAVTMFREGGNPKIDPARFEQRLREWVMLETRRALSS
jgi:hypothetical protein